MAVTTQPEQPEITGFQIALHNFEGPFDLLLHLITSKKLDVTEVALSTVTNDFVAYTQALGQNSDLDEITEFLIVAATLLDLKTARLLPKGELDNEEDLELLEAKDLLFARLLQYRAYKQVAELFATWQHNAFRRYPRAVSLEEKFANQLPPVNIGLDKEEFASLAAAVFRSRPPTTVGTDHILRSEVSVPEQAAVVLQLLKDSGIEEYVPFDFLVKDCQNSMEIVGRFLALLELYKAEAIDTYQEKALETLKIAWTGLKVDPAVVAATNWD